jgi:superfamily II DNA/RNA helicase
MSFSDLGLSPETLRAVEEVGYNTPTPIQEQAIPYVLMGRDVLGIAQTGTGKTASFTLPMIDILAQGRAKARMPRSLILAPTRELANQVAENFILYGKYHKLAMALLIGGESFVEQEKALSRGVDVLIATPGRLMDLFGRGRILLSDVKVLVIDEADRMLDMGFIPDVERIVSMLPPLRQTLFFSATMDAPIRKLADAFLSNPKEVRVAPQQQTAATVSQYLLVVDDIDKREALRHVLRGEEEVRNAFIFCNRKRDVSILYRSLKKHGFDVAQLHGDMPQQERTATLAQFKAGDVKLLVCSDVAARGIDIADVSHVFNFDVPSHCEDYIHRIGRTGRAGREGRAFTLATPEDTKAVAAVEKLIGNAISRLDLEGIETQELSEEAAKAARKGRRSTGTGRRTAGKDERRDGRRDDNRKREPRETAAPIVEDAAEVTTISEVANEPQAETRPEPRVEVREARPEQRSDPRQEGRPDPRARRDRERDRSRGGRRNHPAWEVEEMDHGDDVVAFGGHTPAFMQIDVSAFVGTAEDLISDEDADRLDDQIVQVLDDIEEVDTPDEVEDPRDDDTAPRSRSRRRRRGRGRDRDEAENGDEDSAAVEAVSGEDENEGAAEVASAETGSTSKPRRRRSARRRKVDAVAEQDNAPLSNDDADADQAADSGDALSDEGTVADSGQNSADGVSEKPKRPTRRRKAPAAQAAESEPVANSDQIADDTAAVAEAVTAEPVVADEPAAKPKRTRKPAVKKAAAPRTRTARAKAAAADDGGDATPAEEATSSPEESEAPAVKPKRTRKPAVAKAATTSTRSRKKAVATEDSGEAISEAPAEADQGEAPSAKPKRTRAPRRKAAVSSDPAPETQSGDDGNDDA